MSLGKCKTNLGQPFVAMYMTNEWAKFHADTVLQAVTDLTKLVGIIPTQVLSFFTEKDRRTDSWIRPKTSAAPPEFQPESIDSDHCPVKGENAHAVSCRGFVVAQWWECLSSNRKTLVSFTQRRRETERHTYTHAFNCKNTRMQTNKQTNMQTNTHTLGKGHNQPFVEFKHAKWLSLFHAFQGSISSFIRSRPAGVAWTDIIYYTRLETL